MLWHEIGMLAEPIACSLDLDNDSVVEQTIDGEAVIGREDDGTPLVAGVDELEEQISATGNDGQVSDFIDDQERGATEEADALGQLSFAFGLGKGTDDIGQGGEVEHCDRP